MTMAQFLIEFEIRGGDGRTYAGGMTAGDIEEIQSESDALRAKIEAKRNGAETA